MRDYLKHEETHAAAVERSRTRVGWKMSESAWKVLALKTTSRPDAVLLYSF